MKGAPPPAGTAPYVHPPMQCAEPGCVEIHASVDSRYCPRHRRTWQLGLFNEDDHRQRATEREMVP